MASKSRGRGQVSELIHIAPIKQGYVEDLPAEAPRIRYADRLRTTLEAFHAREEQDFPSVIRLFRGIHAAKWALLDGDTRLLVSVVFDGTLHGYLRALARDIPGMLHMIWSNCEGWLDPRHDPQLLIDFIERHQVRANFFFAQHPQLTVPDVEGLLLLRDVFGSNVDSACDPCRQKLEAQLYLDSAPISNAVRLQQALKKYGKSELSRQGFQQLFGALYRPEELHNALRETYGGCSPEPVAQPRDGQREAEIQGNVLEEYQGAHCARMLFFHFTDSKRARSWLTALSPLIKFGRAEGNEAWQLNIGFTHEGLAALGVNPAVLARFPDAFVEGMDARAATLGDPDSTPARRWTGEHGSQPVHAVVFVHAHVGAGELYAALLAAGQAAQANAEDCACADAHDAAGRDDDLISKIALHLDGVCSAIPELSTHAPLRIGHQDLHRPLAQPANDPAHAYGVEYFGFRDGVSQPRSYEPVLRPAGRGLLANATFLVVRKLLQDPRAFWQSMEAKAQPLRVSKKALAEQVVGRRMDGRRLDSAATRFDAERDRQAFDPNRETPGCPFHSHVRRANPRVETSLAGNPLLMRRSLPYLDRRDGRHVRGLMFLAFNADIETQFELMQRNWMQAGNQVGLASRDRDVMAGLQTPAAAGPASFYAELPDARGKPSALARKLQFEQAFVTLEWGVYLYFPARAALAQL